MSSTYNRYRDFTVDGDIKNIPSVEIENKLSDKEEVYILGKSRLDNISYKYYKDSNYGWLILMANPEVGGLEYRIPDGYVLRIPFPLETTLRDYKDEVLKYIKYYGV